jgi:hypothetical protein
VVKAVFTRCYQEPCEWLSWEHVYPHWIIGEVDGVPSGIVCVGIGRPFGWIEMLMVDPALSTIQKGRLVVVMKEAAYTVLRTMGATGALCTIGDENQTFHRYVQRQQFVKQGTGTIYIKRLL